MFIRFIFTVLAALLIAVVSEAAPDIERGLVLHLPMQTDLRDHSIKTREVKVCGRVELRDGAGWFGGNGSWLELPNIPLHERPFTVAVWLKPTGTDPTYGVLLQSDHAEGSHLLHLMIRYGLRPWLGFYLNDVVSPVSLSNAGEWQHVIFQYTGTHQQIWINGRLICRRAADAYQGTKGRTFIGRNPGWDNVPGHDYEGWMSDFRIYGRALAFEEIVALASASPAAIAVANVKPPPAQAAGSVAPIGVSAEPLLSIAGQHMQLRGKAGAEYIVEASEDLKGWEEIGRFTIGSKGVAEFVDEDAARFRQRFYRIRFQTSE